MTAARLMQAPLPSDGAWRVHPALEALPRLGYEGGGRNRYDDPYDIYRIRYMASALPAP